jgi:hypothetical protein
VVALFFFYLTLLCLEQWQFLGQLKLKRATQMLVVVLLRFLTESSTKKPVEKIAVIERKKTTRFRHA